MNTTIIIIVVVVVLVILGGILAPNFAGRNRAERFHDEYGPEYDRTVKNLGSDQKAQTEMDDRRKHVETLNIGPLTDIQRQRYIADWKAVQANFVDQPGQATARPTT